MVPAILIELTHNSGGSFENIWTIVAIKDSTVILTIELIVALNNSGYFFKSSIEITPLSNINISLLLNEFHFYVYLFLHLALTLVY